MRVEHCLNTSCHSHPARNNKNGWSCEKPTCCGKSVDLYIVGTWFQARSIEEMQEFYLDRLPAIRDAAKHHGYAIGVHGSMRRDFDLIAVPWGNEPSDKDTLAHAIAVAACGITRDGPYTWEKKPQGRSSVSICICWADHSNPDFVNMIGAGHIDLSVVAPEKEIERLKTKVDQLEVDVSNAMARDCRRNQLINEINQALGNYEGTPADRIHEMQEEITQLHIKAEAIEKGEGL